MSKPIHAIVKWYKETPEEYKPDVAFLVTHFTGNSSTITMADTELMKKQFSDWILSHDDDEHQNVGFVVSLRAQIEFLLIRKRGSEEAWRESEEINQRMKEQFISDGKTDMVRMIEEMEEKLPQRKQDWLLICNRWRELLTNELSDEALDSWENEIIAKGVEPSRPIVQGIPVK